MMLQLIIAASVSLLGQTMPPPGSISGAVVNASQDGAPVAGAHVVLRVKLDGQFVTAAEVKADEHGRFVFDNLPASEDYVYLAGANRDGVHYPGPRVQLSSLQRDATVTVPVRDSIKSPNPLVLRRHEIVIQPESGALRVTEKMLIENPTDSTYIGQPTREGSRARTLALSVPSDFARTTFHIEFYGRRFTLIDGKLMTDIPWTPGQRELEFTYVLPNDQPHRVWQRPLDLPCDHIHLTVYSTDPNEVSCNLSRIDLSSEGMIAYESQGTTLPAGHVVRVELGHLPVSFASYARWLALAALVLLVSITGLIAVFRRHGQGQSRQKKNTAVSRRRHRSAVASTSGR